MSVPALRARTRHARHAAFAAWAALLLLECLWHAWWRTPFDPPALALAVVPLLLPLAAMRRPARALLWTAIIAVFYFGHGVSDAWTMPSWRVPALIEAVLSVVLIGAVAVALPGRRTAGTRESELGTGEQPTIRR